MDIKYTTVFDNAISAHINWLVCFEHALNGMATETFDPKVVCDDTACDFGRWLYAHPAVFPSAEHFEDIKNKHRAFHSKAAEIASLLASQANHDVIQQNLNQLQELSNQLIEILFDTQEFSKLKLS